jgi:very-short-patch-repair endonuclease
VDGGWRIYRYTKDEIGREPARIVAEISRALAGVRA